MIFNVTSLDAGLSSLLWPTAHEGGKGVNKKC